MSITFKFIHGQIMQHSKIKTRYRLLSSLIVGISLSGCAVTGDDPWQGWNHGAQTFNDTLDKNIIKPVAQGYQWITPDIVDESITNTFSNVNDIGVMINEFLQFKWEQGGMDLARLVVNSTIGMGGLFDVGQMMDLPKHQEDFGQTLAVWGVPAGPYLVLPIYGASSPRDTLGIIGDAAMNPLTYISIFGNSDAYASTMGATAVNLIDKRADLMTTEKVVNEASGENRYEFVKNAYQQRRQYLIDDGKTKESDLDNDLDNLDKEDKPATTKP